MLTRGTTGVVDTCPWGPGLPDFFGPNIPKTENNIPNDHKQYPKAVNVTKWP
jgi:hypothetical protein